VHVLQFGSGQGEQEMLGFDSRGRLLGGDLTSIGDDRARLPTSTVVAYRAPRMPGT